MSLATPFAVPQSSSSRLLHTFTGRAHPTLVQRDNPGQLPALVKRDTVTPHKAMLLVQLSSKDLPQLKQDARRAQVVLKLLQMLLRSPGSHH